MTTILDRPKSNRLPEPPAHPIWGHMRQAQADPLGFHLSLGTFGPVVGYRAGLWPVVFVHHPEAVGHVLQANYANYSKETFAYDLVRRSLGDELLTTDGERWLSRRQLMQPAFHRKRIEGLAPPMVAAAEAALARWQMGQPLEIAGEMRRLTLDVVGRTLFGVNTLDQAEPIGAALATVLEQNLGQLRSRRMWLWGLLDTMTPGSRRFHTARRELDRVVGAIIARKRAQPQAEDDLLDLLLAARDEESGAALSDEELRTEVLTLLVVGHETTALTLLYAVWIRPSPEWPQRTARSLPEMLFILLFFAAISSLPSLALALILSSFRRKGNLLFRLRVSVSGVATVAALVCFGSKMAGAVTAYVTPGSPLVGQLDRVAWTAMGMAALAWLVSMLPNRLFEATVGPVLYVAKLRTLHALRRLYARLVALSSPVVSYAPSWGEMALRPDFHLYRLAIGILDGRKMIRGQAASMRAQGGLGGGGAPSVAVNWTMSQWRQAEVLEVLLQPLAGEDLDSLAEELVVVSRQAREYLG